MLGLLQGIGIFTIIFLIILVLLLPAILTIIVGIGFANWFGFEGIYWWAFVILFYFIIGCIFAAIGA